jgi:RimJ/RimL family protein N-acetyltransferase
LAAYGGRCKRNRHSVYLITGILQAFTSQGIGTRLFVELEKWARENNIHRLELTVLVHNEAALALYRKMGFEIEGWRLPLSFMFPCFFLVCQYFTFGISN